MRPYEIPALRIGVDILRVARMARLVAENTGILDVAFTTTESQYCLAKRRCHEHLAARFAAKEAVLKALGTGLGRRMRWRDVEIVHNRAGRPRVRLHGEVARWAELQGMVDLDVSLSHTEDFSIAQALIVCQRVNSPPPE